MKKQVGAILDEVLDEASKDLKDLLEERINEIKDKFIDVIESGTVKRLKITKLKNDERGDERFDEVYWMDFCLPELNVKDNGEITINDYEDCDVGISYGLTVADVIKEFLKNNPKEDPLTVLRSVYDQVFFMMFDTAKEFGIKPDDLYGIEETDETQDNADPGEC